MIDFSGLNAQRCFKSLNKTAILLRCYIITFRHLESAGVISFEHQPLRLTRSCVLLVCYTVFLITAYTRPISTNVRIVKFRTINIKGKHIIYENVLLVVIVFFFFAFSH